MAKRLFVGSLPWTTTEQELQDLFSQIGPVESVKVITERDTGRSKGIAFVEMVNEKDAQEAINKLNGTRLGERTIVVNEARPQEDRSGGFGGGNRGGYGGGRDRGGYGGGGYGGGRDRNGGGRGGRW